MRFVDTNVLLYAVSTDRGEAENLRFTVTETRTALVLAAMRARSRFGISYWDAAIVEAARSLACDVVLSEDLNDGHDYDGVRVDNPFRSRG